MNFKKSLLTVAVGCIVANSAIALQDGQSLPIGDAVDSQWAMGQPNGVDVNVLTAWDMIDSLDQSTLGNVIVATLGSGIDTDTEAVDGIQKDFDFTNKIIVGVPGQDVVDAGFSTTDPTGTDPHDQLLWNESMVVGIIGASIDSNYFHAGMTNGIAASNNIQILPIRTRSVDDLIIQRLLDVMPYQKPLKLFESVLGDAALILPGAQCDRDTLLNGLPGADDFVQGINPATGELLVDETGQPVLVAESEMYLYENFATQLVGFVIPESISTPFELAAFLAAPATQQLIYDKGVEILNGRNISEIAQAACGVEVVAGITKLFTEAKSDYERLEVIIGLSWIASHTDTSNADFNVQTWLNGIAELLNGNDEDPTNDIVEINADIAVEEIDQINLAMEAFDIFWEVFDLYYQQQSPNAATTSEKIVERYVSGIDLAVAQGAKVINLGIGINNDLLDDTLRSQLDTSISAAENAGAVIVTAAGDGCQPTLTTYPATSNHANVVVVGSINSQGELAVDKSNFTGSVGSYDFSDTGCHNTDLGNHSNWGEGVDIAAPGSKIRSSYGVKAGLNGMATLGHTIEKNGTEYAAAHVSSALALGMIAKPNLPYQAYIDALKDGATKTDLMNGLVDVDGSLVKPVEAGGYLNMAGMLDVLLGTTVNADFPKAGIENQDVETWGGARKTIEVDYNGNGDPAEARVLRLSATPETIAQNVSYTWKANGEVIGTDSPTLEWAVPRAMAYDITLTVTDAEGDSDTTVAQDINMARPNEPFMTWQTWNIVGFQFCHSNSQPLVNHYEGKIYDDPNCTDDYGFLNSTQGGLSNSGSAVRGCGLMDDPVHGLLRWGVKMSDHIYSWNWEHWVKLSKVGDDTVLRSRYFREIKCSVNTFDDWQRIYSLKDTINMYDKDNWSPLPTHPTYVE